MMEAQCPACGTWSAVVWDDTLAPGGWWWRDADGCPHCGYVALVESECDFREGSE
jgi:endogenous inhibitor of DNA gyrase (YacG/DUF329 family)